MAISLQEASLLSTDKLQRGVIETFARTSPILEQLPFMTIAGNSYQYNVEGQLPEVEYRDVNGAYTEGGGTVVQHNESLVMLGGDVDVDKFIVKTLGNVNDQRAIQTNLKTKRLAQQFTKDFFKGDSSQNGLKFDGLDVRTAKSKQVLQSEAGKVDLLELRELLDMVDGGADVLYMSKAMQREVLALAAKGDHNYIYEGKDAFGRHINMFGDVPIRTVDALAFDEGELSDEGSIYAVKFGAQEAISGLTNGGIMVDDLGELETKPAYRTRIEFYCGMADFNEKAAARLSGIKRASQVDGSAA